ncbi:MAG: hypothetical protein QM639_11940 [Rhodocyclaceae bacterium]|jgi:hypothetical protein
MTFEIESMSFCPSGIAPRWTWWIRGIAGTPRYGIVGTDEDGGGLYLYEYQGDGTPERAELLTPHAFSLAGTIAKHEATRLVIHALHQLGWGRPAGLGAA